jgi:transposase InsO family protein
VPLDSYRSFNAAAESLIGLYKTELIRRRGPWRGLDDVELATLEYVDWFNHRRPHPRRGIRNPPRFRGNHTPDGTRYGTVGSRCPEPINPAI